MNIFEDIIFGMHLNRKQFLKFSDFSVVTYLLNARGVSDNKETKASLSKEIKNKAKEFNSLNMDF